MVIFILALFGAFIIFLFWEAITLKRARGKLKHIVHVNGTRGKSTVSRLIEAGLREGGFRVFCKTTGTDAMTIDVSGLEKPIIRRGRANIKEQIAILKEASRQNAEILVIECMALAPELQFASQHRILKADISVITNIRHDHTDVMGESLEEICDCLSLSIAENGKLFTAEEKLKSRLEKKCKKLKTELFSADIMRGFGEFPENTALALSVCEHLGVSEDDAKRGFSAFKSDPYALSQYKIGGSIAVNALSVNDPESTYLIYQKVIKNTKKSKNDTVLIINNRADRAERARDMLELAMKIEPKAIWLLGGFREYTARKIAKKAPFIEVLSFKNLSELPKFEDDNLYFAIGNIAGEGRELIAKFKEEGETFV